MSNERQAIAVGLLRMFPPVMREGLLDRPEFLARHGLHADARISFGNSALAFKRSTLFDRIREMYRSGGAIEISDDLAKVYEMGVNSTGDTLVLTPKAGDRPPIHVPSFWVLHERSEERLKRFDAEIAQLHIRGTGVEEWRGRVAAGLSDDEIEYFRLFMKATPEQVAATIEDEVRSGESELETLVPRQRSYYDHLIGDVEAVASLADYVANVLPAHAAFLAERARPLPRWLLLCAHSSISEALPSLERPDELLVDLKELAANGDLLSQLAAVEVGLRYVHRNPQLEGPLLDLARQIAAEPEGDGSRFHLTASAFVLVDGELSRLGLFSDSPPFARRLAAFAQASLIERQLRGVGTETSPFADWGGALRGRRFLLQTLVDLRQEPRWLPDFMSAQQLKAEFVSRLAGAAERHKNEIPTGQLQEFLLGTELGQVRGLLQFPFSYLPGPLEGAQINPLAMPNELANELRKVQSAETIEAASFASLVNSALVFRVEPEHTALVTEALRRVKHQVSKLDNDSKAFNLLAGLAVAAAVVRDTDLAAEVRILARILRRRPTVQIEADSLMRIGLIASAAHSDEVEWAEAVGLWLTELSFEPFDHDMAQSMHSHIRQLCDIAPSLWRTVAKAEAAFDAARGLAA